MPCWSSHPHFLVAAKLSNLSALPAANEFGVPAAASQIPPPALRPAGGTGGDRLNPRPRADHQPDCPGLSVQWTARHRKNVQRKDPRPVAQLPQQQRTNTGTLWVLRSVHNDCRWNRPRCDRDRRRLKHRCRQHSRTDRALPLRSGAGPLEGVCGGRMPHALHCGIQRAAENIGGATTTGGVCAGHDRPPAGAADHPQPMPALRFSPDSPGRPGDPSPLDR